MNVSLFQAVSALNANVRWQDMIAENMEGSTAAGFKRREMAISSVAGGRMPVATAQPGSFDSYFTLPKPEAVIDFEQGEFQYTGGRTDVAVEGPGFFEVRLPNGSSAYTRDGRFTMNSQGELVTRHGFKVVADVGTIQLDSTKGQSITIAPSGEVSQGGDVKGRIKLTDFNDVELLRTMGGGFFAPGHPKLKSMPALNSTIRQEFIEAGNSSPTTEMIGLVTAMRAYEANLRVIQNEDQRLDRSIRDLAGPN